MRPLGPLGAYANLLGRTMKLPGAAAEGVRVDRDLRVPMRDGVELLADLYSPWGEGPMPTVLVRTPYGRRGGYGLLYGLVYAQRGLQVLVQSVRGTFGSGGEFAPFDERDDGLDTVGWIEAQAWHQGELGMAGASYLGLVQWAVASAAGERLAAIVPTVTASQFHGATFGGGLALESFASWHAMVAVQERRLAGLHMLSRLARLRDAYDHLPLGELDVEVLGESSRHFREALERSGADDAYWEARSHAGDVADVEASVLLIAGWHDLFTPWQLDDYVALRAAGRDARLLVGPWTHTSRELWAVSTRESIRFLRARLLGDERLLRGPRVRVHVGGSDEWRDLREWPPPRAGEQRLHLHAGGRLDAAGPVESAPDAYRYDPADPTPALGGPVLLARKPVVDNRPLERRSDVLVYSTAPLGSAVEAIGPVRAEVFVRSTLEHFDVFVRVCDVDRLGVSRNVCDALERVGPEAERDGDGVVRVSFPLWPAAHRFQRGHRIRVQVSSGAHPRYARNTGTGEPLVSATTLVAAGQEVFHDPARPSGVTLTVLSAKPTAAG